MAEASAMKSSSECAGLVKNEGVEVKCEVVECGVCGTAGGLPVQRSRGGTPLAALLRRLLPAGLEQAEPAAALCAPCQGLVDDLEQAELEYLRLKEAFEAIITRNPLYNTADDTKIKLEVADDNCDSEDEPLAKKKNKKSVTRKKKECKKKPRTKSSNKDNWECGECGERGTGGSEALIAHRLLAHSYLKPDERLELKNESDYDVNLDFEDFDEESGSEFILPDENGHSKKKGAPKKSTVKSKKKSEKELHQCNECDAKYTSIKRLEVHMAKHSAGKPPYICEVCGARYKHKKACDIHVALHNGISDWKCEECNKLFPSKGALQRHNNIHTGKLNYQCDLCGKSFIHTSSFKMHKLSHSGVKPHACDVCGLALMTRSHLKRHKRVHSGEKSHECRVCGKRFSERYNLAAHAKSHEETALTTEVVFRRRLFRCAFCTDRFERRYMLERHTSQAHGRTLERPPATPRNTMSKLLKMQAQARGPGPGAEPGAGQGHGDPNPDAMDTKEEKSPESRSPAIVPLKVQLSAGGSANSSAVSGASWSGAYLEFGLRHDYAH